VGSFHKNTAKDAFESTLEVIASLAVQFYNKGCAVGLATNGVVTGGGSSNLAATRAAGVMLINPILPVIMASVSSWDL